MIDTKNSFIIWIVITVIISVLAIGAYKWLSKAPRFENRKKEIAIGFIVCVLAVSSLMFLPILFSRIDLHEFGTNLFDSIQSMFPDEVGEIAEGVGIDETELKPKIVPFVKSFSHFLSAIPLKYVRLVVIGVPTLISSLIIIFAVLILFKIREPKKVLENEYTRKHLFEYNEKIVSDLNKKK